MRKLFLILITMSLFSCSTDTIPNESTSVDNTRKAHTYEVIYQNGNVSQYGNLEAYVRTVSPNEPFQVLSGFDITNASFGPGVYTNGFYKDGDYYYSRVCNRNLPTGTQFTDRIKFIAYTGDGISFSFMGSPDNGWGKVLILKDNVLYKMIMMNENAYNEILTINNLP